MLKVILFCSTLDRVGPTNVIYNMLQAYCKNPSDIVFEIVTISPETITTRIEDFRELGLRIHSLNIKRGYRAVFKNKKIRDFIVSLKPDIVHSYGFRADIILSRLNLGPLIVKISSSFNNPFEDFEMQYGRIKGFLMAKSLIGSYKQFANVITCSNFIANKLRNYYKSLSIIYTGVDADYFVPLPLLEKQKKRNELGIPKDCRVYIFIANLIPRKNPEFLIEVFSRLRLPQTLLLIMGDGILLNSCKAICDDPSIVRYLGAQPGTLEYLQISDFYISPSFSEGFPTAVLEAMSVGVVPILSNIIPHREMLSGVPSPFLFDVNDESLENVLSSSQEYERDFDYRQYLYSNFSSHIMQKRYISMYKLLTGAGCRN
ncbi:glycosyltransferase family 4 protein [Alistipes dispar]|uniref:glycosyltransferase family 4 protein n=1 Tax=Alistipes dispar TaxID=2585119 RepID=UPI003A8B5943